MSVALDGLTGTNPRDFLAAVGLLRITSRDRPATRLWFTSDGRYTPVFEAADRDTLSTAVMRDAESEDGPRPWGISYGKAEKRGTKAVFDLKPPPSVFRAFVGSAIDAWLHGDTEAAEYAAAFATDVAFDCNGNTKPTAFHFTAANQQFLDTVEKLRASIDSEWIRSALFQGNADRSGPNLRWDPGADRKYALMASDPNEARTTCTAPLEWLAFRALPLFPVVPRGTRAETTGVRGRGDEMVFTWPLWGLPASAATVRSLLQVCWMDMEARATVGIIAVCRSDIRRSKGFGNFGPANVAP